MKKESYISKLTALIKAVIFTLYSSTNTIP